MNHTTINYTPGFHLRRARTVGKTLQLGMLAAFAASALLASPVTGVTVTTDMGTFIGSDPAYLTDGSGLSSYDTGAIHDAAGPTNSWAGTSLTGTITFNLGGTYDLDGMAVWNFNSVNTYGVQDVTVRTSLDGISYSAIAGAPTSFAIGSSFMAEVAETFSFSTTASYIQFEVASSYGGSSSSLSEVMFTGTAASTPEPATYALFGAGLAVLAFFRRRCA